MILLAFFAFYGGVFLGCVALVLHALFVPNRSTQAGAIASPGRAYAAAISGLLLAVGFAGLLVLAKIAGAAHLLIAPFVLLATILYVVGYLSPAWVRVPVETRICHFLDYLDFTVPTILLPVVGALRKVLLYLGLAVD